MSILTTPERLSQVLIDCHSSIVGSYHYTQQSIDSIERPCWLIFVEDASYPQTGVGQELEQQGYSIAYVGEVFNSDYIDVDPEYELRARQVAEASVRYLFEHPQLQMSNKRGIFADRLRGLNGVQQVTIDGRGAVTLYSRDAVAGNAFWGFTIDITVREQFVYSPVGF